MTTPSVDDLLQHASWVRTLAGRLVADPSRADDVAQEAWTAAIANPPSHAENVRAWLATVVRNVVRGTGRAESRRVARESAVARRVATPSTEEVAAQAELSRELAGHVLALDPIYRDVVLLRWYEDLPPREIASRLGVPVATVRTRLARAVDELRTRLDRSHGDRASWCALLAMSSTRPATLARPLLGAMAAGLLALFAGTVLLVELTPRDATEAGVASALDARTTDGARASDVDAPTDEARRAPRPAWVDRPERARAPRAAPTASVERYGTVDVEGRVLSLEGYAVPNVTVRARDPGLARLEDGTLHWGSHSSTVSADQLARYAQVPAALERALEQHGHAPGMREALLGIDLSTTAVSRGDGSFELDVVGSHARLELADAEGTIVASGVVDGADELVLLVAPLVEVSGVVVDASGAPLEGLRVSAGGATGAIAALPFEFEVREWGRRDEVSTDARGRFDLGLVASFAGASIQCVEGSQNLCEVPVPTSSTRDLRIVAAARVAPPLRWPTIRGLVIDERGAAVAGAGVRLEGAGTQTASDGRFELQVSYASRDSDLVVTKRGAAPAFVAELGARVPRGARDVDDVVVQLEGPSLEIRGRALDAEGRGLAGWLLTLPDGREHPGFGLPVEFFAAGTFSEGERPRTDADGRFTLGGLSRRAYAIELVDPKTGIVHVTEPVPAGTSDLEVRLPHDVLRSSVRGRVLSERGEPVADADVRVLYPVAVGRGFRRDGHARATTTDDDGAFELEHVPRRRLRLSVDGGRVQTRAFEIADDADPLDVRLVVTLLRKFRVELRSPDDADEFEVLDAHGAKLTVNGFHADRESMDWRTRIEGQSSVVCEASELAATLVLYRRDEEVRRVPIALAGTSVQTIRP